MADFDTLLPLAEKGGWKGWCVEPMPHHVKTLKEMAKGLPVSICEYAISDRNGSIKMAVGGGEQWATGANHVVDRNHLGNRLLDQENYKKLRIDTVRVPSITLDSFIEKYHITEIDFCKIDVEGHEATILNSYSWRIKPKFIKIEHEHTPRNLIKDMIELQGYTVFIEKNDLYCIL